MLGPRTKTKLAGRTTEPNAMELEVCLISLFQFAEHDIDGDQLAVGPFQEITTQGIGS
jgi:hypothetical protein